MASKSNQRQTDGPDELDRRRSLLRELHKPNSRVVGVAFEKLRKAGCDPQWLERTVLGLRKNFPFGRPKMYTKEHAQQLKAIIKDLESAADRLERMSDITIIFAPFLADWPSLVNWPAVSEDDNDGASFEELSGVLCTISKKLRKILRAPKLRNIRSMNAAHRLPWIIEQIRNSTGKPHFAEAAILFGAAYNLKISEDHLKEMCRPLTRRSK